MLIKNKEKQSLRIERAKDIYKYCRINREFHHVRDFMLEVGCSITASRYLVDKMADVGFLIKTQYIPKRSSYLVARKVSDDEIAKLFTVIHHTKFIKEVFKPSPYGRIFNPDGKKNGAYLYKDLYIQQSRENRRSATPSSIASSFYVV